MAYFPAEFTLAINVLYECIEDAKDFVTAIIMGKCSNDELTTRIDAPEGVQTFNSMDTLYDMIIDQFKRLGFDA